MKISKKIYLIALIFIFIQQCFSQNNLVQYVDTKIGVIDNRGSACVIGPQMPFGSINPSPQTIKGGMGAYNPKQPIMGFGQLHVSGTGWSKYGHFLISPQVGLAVGQREHDSPKSNEITTAYYYQTNLDRYGIAAGVAPTHHAALYQFTYPTSDSAYVVLDATQSIGDIVPSLGYKFDKCNVEVFPDKKQIRAYIECAGGWAWGKNIIYFIAEFNKDFTESGVWKDRQIKKDTYTMALDENTKQRVGTFCRFVTQKGETVLMKVAISFSGFENAEKYLKSELPRWSIDEVKKAGIAAWEEKLSAIKIETSSEDQMKIFYTAMYHTMVQPRDRTGDNPKWKSDKPYWDDNFAIWDTWRSAFPLFMLIDPEMVRGNVLCFLDRLKHNGVVSDTFVGGVDMSEEQGGNDVDNVIAEALIKGIKGIDWNEAYGLLKFNADNQRQGLVGRNSAKPEFRENNSKYKELGWIPECLNSTSNTLEYAYNDYCVAQIAKKLGKTADYKKYLNRSNGWTNLWNQNLESDGFKGFIDGRKADGTFLNQDPKYLGKSWKNIFYEGSSWTYSYFVPHDIEQLMQLMGGKKMYAERLEHAMNKELIDYSNEPAFWALRTFCHADRPDLNSKWVHHIMKNNYDLTGVTGNDDTGAMSSWYIFSALGFFPNAGQDVYYLNAPLYKKSIIRLGSGETLTLTARNFSEKNIYIKSCKINGKVWKSSIFHHKDIANGGTIEFELSETPTNWGK
ncbi:MAG: GH92 family glycosyl hydrolase [Salinivirgaceae bacterium]|jgi:predicted alpha-1,2-mannosidase|nr:GH92 family glycosyl hydrolase [Salinivirgaceae bacterium]